jgi:hypothetical protein
MNKWTWLTLVAFVAVLGGSYYLLSQPKGKSWGPSTPQSEGEDAVGGDFDEPGDDGDDRDGNYDMLDDPDAGQGAAGLPHSAARPRSSKGGTGIETIDDGDDPGETVQDPVVLEDNDETIEPATRTER